MGSAGGDGVNMETISQRYLIEEKSISIKCDPDQKAGLKLEIDETCRICLRPIDKSFSIGIDFIHIYATRGQSKEFEVGKACHLTFEV